MKNFFRLLITLSVVIPQQLSAQKYIISAKQKWVDTQLDLKKFQRFSAGSIGYWTNGGGNPQQVSASGFPGVFISSALAPALPLGALIGKVNDVVFLIGEDFQGTSPADGRLLLSMNDDDFSDNDGQVKVSLEIKPVLEVKLNEGVNSTAFISAEEISNWTKVFFSGGKVQLSQTTDGNALFIPADNGTSMSYVSFGSTLNAFGIGDFSVKLPEFEFTFDDVENSGGFATHGTYLLTHSLFFVDRFRFLLNNVHSIFDNDLSINCAKNEILLDILLHAPDPAIRGEGHGYHPLIGLIPIPLGWEDGLCPDFKIDDMKVRVHLVPFVDEQQTIHFRDAEVEVEAKLELSILDFLPQVEDVKKKVTNELDLRLTEELRKPSAKKALETGFLGNLTQLAGKPQATVTNISVDENGISLNIKY